MKKSFCITDYGAVAGKPELQTAAIQAVLDLCKEEGGTVVVPAGNFRVASLRMWSDTTLYLCTGARLEASEICEDYEVYPVPEGVALRTDMEMITQYYENRPWVAYRRAILSVYGGKNIAIIGEPDSHIDGMDCADPAGEEGYRGPHGVFLTNVDGITLRGYSIENCGNFMHQVDNCRHIVMENVTCIGGSDGIHLHYCDDVRIEDCVFRTGDDCIAGINMSNLVVRNCELNTSCDIFRAGGSHILVENCRMWGPGIYPHRKTVVQGVHTDLVRNRKLDLPQNEGRHNLISVWTHFASTNYPADEPYHDILFRNCSVENADMFLEYHADCGTLESGTHLTEMMLENVTFTNLLQPSAVVASPEEPFVFTMKNVRADFAPAAPVKTFFAGNDPATKVIVE